MRGARLNPIAAELNGAASERGDRYRQRAALIRCGHEFTDDEFTWMD